MFGITVVLSLIIVSNTVTQFNQEAKATFFVATTGSDAWSGKLPEPNAQKTDGPFATLARARDAVREMKAKKALKEPVTIMVRSGKYFLEQTLVLGSEDSGTQDCPITYTAYPGEKPILSGGRKITGWKPYKGKILQCELPEAKNGKWKFRQLFFNGQRQIRARTPNFDPENPLYGGWAFMEGAGDRYGATASDFKYRPGLFRQQLSKPTQTEVYFFVGAGGGWGSDIVPIKAIDYENRIIHTEYVPWGPIASFNSNRRFRVENVLEELDQPGEWCLDWKEGQLYFWPPGDLDETAEVVAPALDTLIVLRGAKWTAISGFTFTENFRGSAMLLEDTEQIRIENNHFYAVGGMALVLRGRNNRNLIQHNEISYAGSSGIYLGGRACFNQVLDNHVHHYGFFNKYAAGIEFPFYGATRSDVSESHFSDGNLIAHNYVHDVPRDGIMLGANPFGRYVVEYNVVQRTCLETSDAGAIRAHMDSVAGTVENLSDIPKMTGHIIRYNLIIDVVGCSVEAGKIITPFAWPTFAVYLDDLSANCIVYGNIVIRSGFGAFFNAGKNHTVENNIFVDCKYQVASQVPPGLQEGGVYKYATDNRIVRNIFYTTDPEAFLFRFHGPKEWTDELIKQSDYNLFFKAAEGEYSIQWPGKDVGTGVKILSLADWQAMGYDNHSVIADPMFVDPEHDDYRLKPESPAFKLGFQPINVDIIGLRGIDCAQ